MSALETAQVAHNLIQLGLVSPNRVSESSRASSHQHWRSRESRDRTPFERKSSHRLCLIEALTED